MGKGDGGRDREWEMMCLHGNENLDLWNMGYGRLRRRVLESPMSQYSVGVWIGDLEQNHNVRWLSRRPGVVIPRRLYYLSLIHI